MLNATHTPPRQLIFMLAALVFCLSFCPRQTHAQVQDLPWEVDPDCGSIVTEGIVAVTCGTAQVLPQDMQFTFGLINLIGALPAAGRVDVSMTQAAYHHPSWVIDSLGNVFGITMDNAGNIYVTASSNYSSEFFSLSSVIRYGDIGGGADDVNAAGTVYKIDAIDGQASVFSVLPQQAFAFTNTTCEGIAQVDRFTGPGLGNIVYHTDHEFFYVTNFEDGRIYRLDPNGNILDSYDPLSYDDGAIGTPTLTELAYGIDISNDGTQLFFGNIADEFSGGVSQPSIYSIDLQGDGSFPGVVDNSSLPAGATWDNYVDSELLHYTMDPLNAISSVSYISDLEFTPSGDLLIGNRGGCQATVHTSYNHGGRTVVVGESGGFYNNYLGNIYTSNGVLDDENAYGGVSVLENPNGTTEYVISSADMLSEQGPHGICTQEAGVFGASNSPASPAGVISYLGPGPGDADAKGIGGDVFVFKACVLSACPTAIEAVDRNICSGETIDLDFFMTGGTPDDATITWTDSDGNVVFPIGVTIENTDCAPLIAEYYVTAVCLEDSTNVLQDTAFVTVLPTDLSPFITIIEEPCNIDVIIDPDCADHLTLVGDIPDINPGDSGTVTVTVMQTAKMSCASLDIELTYNCACSISDLNVTPLDCVDGFFLAELDFAFENTSGQFEVTDQDGMSLGAYDYSALPIQLGPFLGDGSTIYSFTVQDTGLVDCTNTIEFGPVNCTIECNASNDGPICEGDTLGLNEDGGDAVSWEWFSDGGAVISDPIAQNPTATNVTDGEEFSVIITTASGLIDTCTTIAGVFTTPTCNATSNSPICIGEDLLLMEDGGDAVSWFWTSDGAAVINNPGTQNPTATEVSDGEIFTVEITDANGCVSTCSVTATVNPDPFCLIVTNLPLCIGETLDLSEEGGSAVSWTWSTDGGAVIDDPTAQVTSATNVSDGETFTVELEDANGCTSTCSITAVVNDQPVCNAGNNGPICQGEPLGLFEEGGEAASWSWSTDGTADIDDPMAQNPTATAVTDGETFTVIITDANGCSDTCTTTAIVFPTPACNAENDGPICAGDPLNLSENGGDAVSWSWTSDGNANINDPTDQNPVAANVADGEIFTVEITDANGCISSCSTTASVFDAPEVEALNNGPICEGDILILEANITGGTPPFTYTWSHVNGFSSGSETVYIQMTTFMDAGTYELEITDANGCTSSAFTEVEITPNLTDPGSIEGDEYFCGPGFDPAPITEVTPPSGAPGPIDYFWMQLEEGAVDWEIIPGAEGPVYDPGPIYVTTQYSRCVRIDGCISALESNIVTKTVGDEVDVNIMGPTAVCLGDEAFYFVVPTPGATYSWNFGPGATPPTSGNSWAMVSWDNVGFRTITLTVSTAECTGSNFLDIIVTNSQVYCDGQPSVPPAPGTSAYEQPGVQIFPNPFNDRIQLQFDEPVLFKTGVQISNMQGRVLQRLSAKAGTGQLELDLSDLPPGLYILSLESPDGQTQHHRIIKQ
ncbi:MAG: T9SS type A sorting domain-containing protein [Bacteroidetes bacterium]|nr:T9SS type A sorting domain-containing protein [Bacteroidota bacterium]